MLKKRDYLKRFELQQVKAEKVKRKSRSAFHTNNYPDYPDYSQINDYFTKKDPTKTLSERKRSHDPMKAVAASENFLFPVLLQNSIERLTALKAKQKELELKIKAYEEASTTKRSQGGTYRGLPYSHSRRPVYAAGSHPLNRSFIPAEKKYSEVKIINK
jgi:hypothetical protein